jgi:RNA 2',3'-cyclic 3'-phosphodiesterase
MSSKIRTFIAIDTPPEFKIQMEKILTELHPVRVPVRWEQPYKLHLTLKFLGDVDSIILEKLKLTLAGPALNHRPFWLRYNGFGFFPHSGNPRIIWVGCTPLSPGLEHLYNDIEDLCQKFGFEREKREFHPHITIGRVKDRSGKERQRITDLTNRIENITFDTIEDEVQSILLMKSDLRPGGSEYSILKQFSLTS